MNVSTTLKPVWVRRNTWVRSAAERTMPSPLPCDSPRPAFEVGSPAASNGRRYLSRL
ncbi:hypothetical protein PQR02_02200 [Paraburkholderia sediminicola]|uniref:Uncharacterized protein n=1 Tax=Paraburkholderia rhynchosiae TaxID=487049 RepID=A0ACC7N4J8_9BURK